MDKLGFNALEFFPAHPDEVGLWPKGGLPQYNIKTETRTLFYSDGYKYDNLKDALNYAKLCVERKRASSNE